MAVLFSALAVMSMTGAYERTPEQIRTKIDLEVNKVSSINSDEIISILKEEIENFDTLRSKTVKLVLLLQ